MKLILFEKSRVELEFTFFNLYDKSPETLWELRSIRASRTRLDSLAVFLLVDLKGKQASLEAAGARRRRDRTESGRESEGSV